MSIKKRIVGFGLSALLGLAGCGREDRRVITIKGSDTMVLLGQRWAETYMHHHPGVTVQVTGGGSGTGIAALINGATNICEASRPMKEQERQQVRARHGKDVKEIAVALDGVAIYVHESNAVAALSMEQIEGIYTGRVANWSELGGDDAAIVAYSRENNSGTYVFFKEHVLRGADFAARVQTLPGTAAVVNAVSQDRRSIGYGGIAYAAGIRAVPVRRDASSPPIAPSLASVQDGSYPLARELYFYTVGEPVGGVKAFVDWVLGDEGQQVCELVGYYPLRRR